MSFEVKTTPDFERSLKRIAKKQQSIRKDVLTLILQLKQEPHSGIEICTNLFKVRLNISGSNKGKSGGARVITYVVQTKETVLLTEIFLKSEFDTIDEDLLIKRLSEQGYIE